MSRSRKGAYPRDSSKRFDPSCRNHGGCAYCEGGRLHADRKYREAADAQLHDLLAPCACAECLGYEPPHDACWCEPENAIVCDTCEEKARCAPVPPLRVPLRVSLEARSCSTD